MKVASALLLSVVFAAGANAAEVCTGLSGTYGSVTVTRSGTCAGWFDSDGLTSPAIIAGTCTFAFNPAVTTSQLTAKITGVTNNTNQVGFNVNGAPYTLVGGDVNTTLVPPDAAGNLTIVGNQVTSPSFGAGTISFTNAAPAATTSIDFVKTGVGNMLGVVCFDDAPVAATVAATVSSVPTLSEWAMIMMASLMAMFAFTRMRRQ
jgi:hypothetical protein